MVVFWVLKFCQNEKRKLVLWPYQKTFWDLKNIYSQKNNLGFWIGFTKFRRGNERGARLQNVFIVILIMLWFSVKSFLRC
jgi:hypothetical protein